MCGVALAVTLLIPNYKKFGKATARRLYPPLGVALGGACLTLGMTFPIASLLADAMSKYTDKAEDGYTLITSTPMPTVLVMVRLMAASAVEEGW